MNVPQAISAAAVPARAKASSYPEPFASMVAGRTKQQLGDFFGLANFGINRTTLPPGAISSLFHRHSLQDEIIFILQGRPTLRHGDTVTVLEPGMCAGFPAGGLPHQLRNESDQDVVYLEIGDRTAGDEVEYPEDDLMVATDPEGRRRAAHKNGDLY